MDVEAWRDAILAVSGTLDDSLGGPSFDLADADNHRRTLYARISRHNLDPLLRLFDFPDPNITSDGRPVTMVPLQQLFVLNSSLMATSAKALAARCCADDSDESRRASARQSKSRWAGPLPKTKYNSAVNSSANYRHQPATIPECHAGSNTPRYC